MLLIIICREFIARSTKTRRSIGQLSASALLHPAQSSAVFIINIAESDFRHAHLPNPRRTPHIISPAPTADHPVGPPTEHSHPWSVGSPPFSQRTSRVTRGSSR